MGSHRGILPREGLYIDPIVILAKKTILHPIFALCVFAFCKLNASEWPAFQTPVLYGTILSLALWINDFLSHKARNNWTTDSNWEWSKEIVVVTGGSSGIGESVVRRLVADGVRVVILDVVPANFTSGSKLITHYRCDLSDESEIRDVCNRIRKEVGHPTVLINNAGLSRGRTVSEGTYHDNSITIRTNLLAPFLLTKEFLPNMIQHNHGHIFNISSMSAFVPPAGLADYGASKAGLVALHEALGLEIKYRYGAPKIRTSIAVLSFTKTPLFKGETNQSGFLSPLMHVDTVGDAIVDTLYSGYGRDIFLPGICGYLTGLRQAPHWLQELIRGGSESLKVDFKGRQKINPTTGKLM